MGTAPSQGLGSSPQLAEGPWASTRPPLSINAQLTVLTKVSAVCPAQWALKPASRPPRPPRLSLSGWSRPSWGGTPTRQNPSCPRSGLAPHVVSSRVGAQVLSPCGPHADLHLLDPPLNSKPLSPTLSPMSPLGCPNLQPGPRSPGLCGSLLLDFRGTALKPQGVLHAAAQEAPLCSAGWGASQPLKIEARVLRWHTRPPTQSLLPTGERTLPELRVGGAPHGTLGSLPPAVGISAP